MADHPHETPHGPDRVCLHCQAGWLEVHRMAIEEDELELAKEKALETDQFERGSGYLESARSD